VRAGSFFARDNIANFIDWCRHEIHVPESVMFETNDLVQRLNEKNVILCLLEVGGFLMFASILQCIDDLWMSFCKLEMDSLI